MRAKNVDEIDTWRQPNKTNLVSNNGESSSNEIQFVEIKLKQCIV